VSTDSTRKMLAWASTEIVKRAANPPPDIVYVVPTLDALTLENNAILKAYDDVVRKIAEFKAEPQPEYPIPDLTLESMMRYRAYRAWHVRTLMLEFTRDFLARYLPPGSRPDASPADACEPDIVVHSGAARVPDVQR